MLMDSGNRASPHPRPEADPPGRAWAEQEVRNKGAWAPDNGAEIAAGGLPQIKKQTEDGQRASRWKRCGVSCSTNERSEWELDVDLARRRSLCRRQREGLGTSPQVERLRRRLAVAMLRDKQDMLGESAAISAMSHFYRHCPLVSDVCISGAEQLRRLSEAFDHHQQSGQAHVETKGFPKGG